MYICLIENKGMSHIVLNDETALQHAKGLTRKHIIQGNHSRKTLYKLKDNTVTYQYKRNNNYYYYSP